MTLTEKLQAAINEHNAYNPHDPIRVVFGAMNEVTKAILAESNGEGFLLQYGGADLNGYLLGDNEYGLLIFANYHEGIPASVRLIENLLSVSRPLVREGKIFGFQHRVPCHHLTAQILHDAIIQFIFEASSYLKRIA